MTPQEFLNWIVLNGTAATVMGILFLLFVLVVFSHFNTLIIDLVRGITGNYPPPSHVECNCSNDDDEEETQA